MFGKNFIVNFKEIAVKVSKKENFKILLCEYLNLGERNSDLHIINECK